MAERIVGDVPKSFTTAAEVTPDTGLLIFADSGVCLLRGEASSRWYVVSGSALSFMRGSKRLLLRVARGRHSAIFLTWQLSMAPFIHHWVEKEFRKDASEDSLRFLSFRNIYPQFEPGKARLLRALKMNNPNTDMLIFSVISEALVYLSVDELSVGLAPVPRDLPENIRDLIKRVRSQPDVAWPLKEASELVGYSPFHFSRIFKQMTGFGFHEFVDRTRTEMAVEQLCASDIPVDLVAANAGFGTTQGLRESVKEYLGLVPSEFRSEPDDHLYG
jgi:AraC-like DNA-binding protein